MQGIFDSHAHYDDKRFQDDREQVLRRVKEQGVKLILNAASDLESAELGIQIARGFDHVYCSVGVHPHEAKDAPEDLEDRLRALAGEPKVVAVGEIGLDYHYDFSPRPRQREIFRRQLLLARELDLPVIIHDREAHADTMALLRELRPKGVVHCYSGSAEMAREILDLGMYIGFTGVVTFKNARRALEAVRAVPVDRLLVETDCPYMAPEPFRGKRCDSSMLPYTIQAIAREKGMDPQEVADASCRNACRMYAIRN